MSRSRSYEMNPSVRSRNSANHSVLAVALVRVRHWSEEGDLVDDGEGSADDGPDRAVARRQLRSVYAVAEPNHSHRRRIVVFLRVEEISERRNRPHHVLEDSVEVAR